jgi:hypothetical protein
MVQPVIDPAGYWHVQVRVLSFRRLKLCWGETRTRRGTVFSAGDTLRCQGTETRVRTQIVLRTIIDVPTLILG